MEVYDLIAPFVLKTYQMVNDPSTDALISWSRGNNSFVVLDSLEFAQCILPIYFKHNNFSSFIRQLNTYGFRKVDPDRWEFAHESFLRGQGHLLKNITRRKSNRGLISSARQKRQARNGDNCALSQLIQLKQEQRALDEEVEIMNRRLQATEMEPQQMMAFLAQVTDDPGILSRLVLDKEASVRQAEKKKRLRISSPPSFSCTNAVTSMPEPKRRMENGKDEKHLVGVIPPINLGSAQSSTMDISLATDGDLYTLVNSAIAAKNAGAKATATATNTGISTAWPFSSFNQNDGNSSKISIHETGGLESNSHPCVFGSTIHFI